MTEKWREPKISKEWFERFGFEDGENTEYWLLWRAGKYLLGWYINPDDEFYKEKIKKARYRGYPSLQSLIYDKGYDFMELDDDHKIVSDDERNGQYIYEWLDKTHGWYGHPDKNRWKDDEEIKESKKEKRRKA